MISKRARGIGMSPTLRISALAGQMLADGVNVLDLCAGQPDFPTPEEVKAAGKRAIDENRTGYTANQGLAEFREAIAACLRERRGLEYATDEILVSTGAKASLYFAAMAMFDPGDEVIVPRPYWVSYPEQLRMAGAVPVFVECHESNGFKLDPADLERTIGSRTRAVMLNYPSNPTGACYGREHLEPLAEVCTRRGIWIIADEIYSRLLFDGRRFVSVAEISPEVRERCLIIDGMSKTYSMTGWRIGYTAGPREVISAMARIQSHSTSNAASISQWASIEALAMGDGEIERRVAEFQRRRDVIVAGLRELPGVTCLVPEGSFYAFPNVSGCFRGPVADADGLAGYLLERAKVAVVPGEGFGAPSHMRVSYAVDVERIEEGLARIGEALADLPA